MKKIICFILCTIMLFTVAACGTEKSENSAEQQTAAPSEAEQASFEWTRQGYFQDENENMLSVTWMEDIDEPGWYVGCMLGEDWIEDSWGGTLPQEGSTLHGALPSSGSKDDITVTVSEEGEDGLLLVVEGGETYHFTSMGDMTASIIVTIGTEGFGMIGYEEGETVPELDPEWPYQSAQVNLGDPATYTFAAAPEAGSMFVKWTKNGEDFSTEPVITVLLDESAEFVAVFEEDPGWQNPVMNFIGEYQSDRAHALVECSGTEDALITIEKVRKRCIRTAPAPSPSMTTEPLPGTRISPSTGLICCSSGCLRSRQDKTANALKRQSSSRAWSKPSNMSTS